MPTQEYGSASGGIEPLPGNLENLALRELSDDHAKRIRILKAACEELDNEPYIAREFLPYARSVSEKLKVLASPWSRPVSTGTMKRMYYRWRRYKKWQALVDMRCSAINPKKARTAQSSFRSHLASLARRHPRSLAAAVRELKQEWDAGKSIPGYNDIKRVPGKYPAGWSEDNLVKKMPKRSSLKYSSAR